MAVVPLIRLSPRCSAAKIASIAEAFGPNMEQFPMAKRYPQASPPTTSNVDQIFFGDFLAVPHRGPFRISPC